MVPSVETMPPITKSGPAFLITKAKTKLVAERIRAVDSVLQLMWWRPGDAHMERALDRVPASSPPSVVDDDLDVLAILGNLQGLLHGVLIKLP